MERITPEEHDNYIFNKSSQKFVKKKCIAEIGIFGISIGYIFSENPYHYHYHDIFSYLFLF